MKASPSTLETQVSKFGLTYQLIDTQTLKPN